MSVITFHRILRGCEEGDRESWRLFLRDYTSVVSRLVAVYLPSLAKPQNHFWQETLGSLAAKGFERLRTFDHQAEREFLLDFRGFLLERGGELVDPSQDANGGAIAVETVEGLLKGLPLAHQQILFLKLAGYSDATIEKIYTITPAIAQEGLERLQADYTVLLGRKEDTCLWPGAWTALLRQVRAAKTEACVPPRQHVRILDGQISWYDKEPMEQHTSACLHCLECWTALREVVYWRREASPISSAEIDALLSGLPLQAEGKPSKPLLKRMFS